MHIPDGFLSFMVSVICWIITAAVLAVAISRANKTFNERQIPLMGIVAAFIFAAQMINFPVAGGTSGHLLGGALAAILVGPWAGMLVMTAVIAVQGLLFQDGGLLAMGANILNMGLLTVALGYGFFRLVQGRSRGVRLAVAGIAAWFSVMTGALFTSLQLWLSGSAILGIVVPAMLGIHALIGLGEAAITVAALAFLMQVRPDLVENKESPKGGRAWIFVGMAIALGVVILSPFASVNPDGLNRVALDLGFMKNAAGSQQLTPLSGYAFPLLGASPLGKILAGIAGVLVVAGLIYLIARSLRSKKV
jgi:cobalt/nickel transport system permease protein